MIHTQSLKNHNKYFNYFPNQNIKTTANNSFQPIKGSPLIDAVATNDLTALRHLIDSGANVNERSGMNSTPLILAAIKGHFTALQMLAEAGADINAVDNYKQSALHYAVNKYMNSHPNFKNKDHLEIAAYLIQKGAVSVPIRIDPEHFFKTASTLFVKYPEMAKDYVTRRFHQEMFRTDSSHIRKTITAFLANPNREKANREALYDLINIDSRFNSRFEAITHLAHLNSWIGEVADYDHTLQAEGWYMSQYPPLKVKSLLQSLEKIQNQTIDCEQAFGEPQAVIMERIVSEIESQLTTYYTQVNQDTIKKLPKELQPYALNAEVTMIREKILQLPADKEFAIASGFPGHAIYIGFRHEPDHTITRRVYNLGGGANAHVFSDTGRIYPDVIRHISPDKFKYPDGPGAMYLKGVLEAKLGLTQDYNKAIYAQAALLEGRRIENQFREPAQKQQLAGNCVLKNNNCALRNRLQNDKLFKWLKSEEISQAFLVSDLSDLEYRNKEAEKTRESLNWVVRASAKRINQYSPTVVTTIYNLNRFLAKRLPLTPPEPTASVSELAARLSHYHQHPDLKSWLKMEGVQPLLLHLAEATRSEELKQAVRLFQ